MKINQSKNQMYTKGLDNTESELLLFAKRYFEKNPEELKGSIDNIVMEVLSKVKMDLLNGTLAVSVSSVNNKTGQVTLSAEDVGAEPTIKRNTAFNKDFGDEPDTVCEGNDERLSDKRYPKEHEHSDYIHKDDIDKYIERALNKRGIKFIGESNISISRDILLTDGAEITEV